MPPLILASGHKKSRRSMGSGGLFSDHSNDRRGLALGALFLAGFGRGGLFRGDGAGFGVRIIFLGEAGRLCGRLSLPLFIVGPRDRRGSVVLIIRTSADPRAAAHDFLT